MLSGVRYSTLNTVFVLVFVLILEVSLILSSYDWVYL